MRGYKEEGTITTPFDMAVLNDMDRFHLVQDVIERLPQLKNRCAYLKQEMQDKLIEHKCYIQKMVRTCLKSKTGNGAGLLARFLSFSILFTKYGRF